ncbi:MAG: oligosaccharide flippase family protein, partial [Ignavibacteria bacterium]|nr:oligosaccharide flippase family protein [Ignavibacteria bacterium]
LIISATTILSVFLHLGLQGSFTKYFSSAANDDDRKKIFSSLLVLISFASIPITSLLLIFSNEFAHLIVKDASYSFTFSIAILSMLFMTYSYFVTMMYVSLEKSKLYLIKNVIASIVNFIGNIIFLFVFKLGIDGIFYAQIISSLFLILNCWGLIKRYFTFSIEQEWSKKIIRFGYPLFFSSLFTTLAEVFDRFLVEHYLGIEQTGIYYLGYRFGYILSVFVISFRNSWIPHFYNVVDKLGSEQSLYLGKVFTKLLATSGLIVVTLSLFSDDLIKFKFNSFSIFPDVYKDSIPVIPLVVLGYFFNNLMSFYSIGPYKSGKSYHFLIADLLCFMSNLVFNIWLIQVYGIAGAALATMLAFMLGAAYLKVVSTSVINIKYEYIKDLSLFISMIFSIIVSNIFDSFVIDLILFAGFLLLVYKSSGFDLKRVFYLKEI